MPENLSATVPVSYPPTPRRILKGEAFVGLMLTLPAGVAYFLMLLLPTAATILLAFTDYELGAIDWGGLAPIKPDTRLGWVTCLL